MTGLPPGPRLPAAVQAALMARYWPRFISACRRRYGSVFTMRIATMGTLVYLDDPAEIKKVFAGSPSVYHAGEANSMLGGVLGASSVLVIDDDVHRSDDAKCCRRSTAMRRAASRRHGRDCSGQCRDVAGEHRVPGGPQDVEITLEVILRTVIGASDPARLTALREVMPKLLNVTPWASLAIASPNLQRLGPWRALRRNIEEANHLLYAEIADRRADPDLATRSDALAMLVRAGSEDGVDGRGMTDAELRDQLMTLLVAGHDTTATGLSWALERLTRHPAILDKAVRAAEASAAGDPAGDEFLDAVAKETLRIRPVVFDVGRVLTEPVELAGYRLPAGAMVAPGIGLVHSSSSNTGSRSIRSRPDDRCHAQPTTWFRSAAAIAAVWERRSRWSRCGSSCVRCCGGLSCAAPRRPTNGRRSSTSSWCRTAVRGFGSEPFETCRRRLPQPRRRRRVCIVRECTRRHRCHRDRGTDGAGSRPQWPVDRRSVTRTGRRARSHHDLR